LCVITEEEQNRKLTPDFLSFGDEDDDDTRREEEALTRLTPLIGFREFDTTIKEERERMGCETGNRMKRLKSGREKKQSRKASG
jgi:hypothetical protein